MTRGCDAACPSRDDPTVDAFAQAEHSLSPSSVTGGDRSQTFGSQPGAAGPGAGGMRGESKDGREHPGGSRPQEGAFLSSLFMRVQQHEIILCGSFFGRSSTFYHKGLLLWAALKLVAK